MNRSDYNNPLRARKFNTGLPFEEELQSIRAFLFGDWSNYDPSRGYNRVLVEEMMALVRHYEALGFQFEPNEQVRIRHTNPEVEILI